MQIHHIDTGANWTRRLAQLIEDAQAGDVIVVPDYDVLELATNAAKRMNKWPAVRIMTEQAYAETYTACE